MSEENEKASIEIGGIKFTGGKMVAVFMAISATVGSLYGAFEVYKDYTDMKEMIQTYVAPDLSGIERQLSVLEERTESSVEFTRDINTNLRADIRRIEGVLVDVERDSRQMQREVSEDIRSMRSEIRQMEQELKIQIRDALDNPLAN
jgi:hypothetical protein